MPLLEIAAPSFSCVSSSVPLSPECVNMLVLHKCNAAGVMGSVLLAYYFVIVLDVCTVLTKIKFSCTFVSDKWPVSFFLYHTNVHFANTQRGAMTPMEVCEGLGLYDLTNRIWHIQGTCALKGDGLYEGLDWLATTLDEMRASGRITSASSSAS